MNRMLLSGLGVVTLSLLPVSAQPKPEAPSFAQPISCVLGVNCVIQQYFDHDPGTGAKDYRCSAQAYDGHDGVDFRIPDQAAMARGVPVVAAADGFVVAVRDGEPDAVGSGYDKVATEGKGCGNAVILYHPNGWETQYCHMRKGSISVRTHARVKTGTVLGFVGQSGRADFPHLHFGVRHKTDRIDPFFGGAACSAKASLAGSMWRAEDREALAYRPAFVLNSGFTTAALEMSDVEKGNLPAARADSPALIAYVRAIGLLKGDVQHLVVKTPEGAIFVENAEAPLERNKAQFLLYSGRKRPPTGWIRGRYVAHYTITRQGRVIAEKTFSFAM